jgi:hypothetical protein
VRDAATGAILSSKWFSDASVHAAVPLDSRVVVGRSCKPWTSDHGPKVEIRGADLESVLQELVVDDAGFVVATGNGVIAATGIDLHLWWPDGRRSPFSLHDSPGGPPGEIGPGALSSDGRVVAVLHDRRDLREALAIVVAVDDPTAPPLSISEPSRSDSKAIALSPNGRFVAIGFERSPEVIVYRTDTGAVLGEIEEPGAVALTWLDATTLVIGGTRLAAWSVA